MPDQHVDRAEPQLAQDLDPGDGVDVRVQVLDADAGVGQVVRQVLGHLLRQRGDEHPPAVADRVVDPQPQVVDLALGRLEHHLGVDQAGRPDDLLDHLGGLFDLVGAGSRRDEDALGDALAELLEAQRPVVDGRGQAEPVLDQHVLA